MLGKIFVFTVALAVVVAEPVEKRTFSSGHDVTYLEYPGYELLHQPELSSIISSICSLIGYKISALGLAVSAIEWLVSNFFVIIIGAVSALGFCKITGKCGFSYEEYIPIPVSQLEGLATPENIETAEKFFLTAVEKYAEKKRSA